MEIRIILMNGKKESKRLEKNKMFKYKIIDYKMIKFNLHYNFLYLNNRLVWKLLDNQMINILMNPKFLCKT